MAIVSITRLRVRSWRYLPAFMFYSLRSFLQARRAEGNLHSSLLRDAGRVFWTRTMWTTEEAMKSFMLSGAHRQVMPHLLNWCNEAALVHWAQESQNVPEWDEAHRRLKQEGRRSKVHNPSPAHEQYTIPEPRKAA